MMGAARMATVAAGVATTGFLLQSRAKTKAVKHVKAQTAFKALKLCSQFGNWVKENHAPADRHNKHAVRMIIALQ
jgi:hypothetical protein